MEKLSGDNMLSVGEVLEKVGILLTINGFNVTSVKPERRIHDLASGVSTINISPVEFVVAKGKNSVRVWLYGNRLVINGKFSYTDSYSVTETYREIVKKLKLSSGAGGSAAYEERAEQKHKPQKGRVEIYKKGDISIRYLAASVY